MTAGRRPVPSPDRTSRWLLRTGLGVGMLGGSWYALKEPHVQRADVKVGDTVRRLGSRDVDRAVALTTDLGSVYSVVGMAAALAVTGRRRAAADVACVGALAWNVAQYSKTRVRRLRPYESEGVRRLVRPPTGSSFPSGHSAVGAAVMTVLADGARGRWSRNALYALGAYVGWSRVFVGVHYPTDVIGGAGMGLALGSVWRGPPAAVGRGAFTAGIETGRRLLPRLARLGVWLALGVRLRRRRAAAPQEETVSEAV